MYSVDHLITLLTLKYFSIPLIPGMFPVWDFVVEIFARRTILNIGLLLQPLFSVILYDNEVVVYVLKC